MSTISPCPQCGCGRHRTDSDDIRLECARVNFHDHRLDGGVSDVDSADRVGMTHKPGVFRIFCSSANIFRAAATLFS